MGLLARNGALNVAGTIISGTLGFLLLVVLTRGLGPTRAGAFLEGVALLTIFGNILELGADTGVTRMIARYRALGRTNDLRQVLRIAIWPILPIGAALSAAIFLAAPQLARTFSTGHDWHLLVPYIRLFGPFVPVFAVSSVLVSATTGFGTFLPSNVIDSVAKPAVRLALIGGAIVAGLGSVAIGLGYVLPLLGGLAVAGWWTVRLLRRAERMDVASGPPAGSRSLAGEFWRFSAPRGLGGALQILIAWLDTLLIGGLASTREAGIYTASIRLLTVGTSITVAIGVVLSPQITALMTRGLRDRAEGVLRTTTWWMVAPSFPFYLAAAIFAPFLLRVFGRGAGQARTALLILAFAAMVFSLTGPVTQVLLMAGKSSWNLFNTVGALAINVGLNIWLIPRLGMTGAAIAWLASGVFDNVAALIEVRVLLRLSPLSAQLWVVVAASAVTFGAGGVLARVVIGDTAAGFLAYIAVAGVAYVAILWSQRRRLHIPSLRRLVRERGRITNLDPLESLA